MPRRTRSTFLPYTTLFRCMVVVQGIGAVVRRVRDRDGLLGPIDGLSAAQLAAVWRDAVAEVWQAGQAGQVRPTRSEEHTSELQSPSNLGCRLLPGKRKEKG